MTRLAAPLSILAFCLFSGLLGASVTVRAQEEGELRSPADSPSVTLSVEFYEERQGGQLTGCFVGYDQVVEDHANRNGAPVRLQGSVSMAQAKPGLLATYFQLFPTDLFRLPDGKMRGQPFKPAYAYATVGNVSTAGRETVPDTCPDDNGYCNGYFGDDLIKAMTLLATTRRLTVAFQRHRPGLEVISAVNFGPPSHTADGPLDDYLDCIGRLERQSLNGNV